MKKIVFTFGRFNPPTTGHHLLATKVKDVANKRNADYRIFGSSSQDSSRNPLSPTDKFRFMKKILKGFNVDVDRNAKSPFDVLQKLSKAGYEDVTMVVGADRVAEFKKNMSRYIGKKGYENISKFNVVSAGDRDPDAEGITGMSASKMRAAAKEGKFDAFRVGMPRHVSERDAKGLFNAIRKGMGVRGKIQESGWFDFDEYQEFSEQMQLDEGFFKDMLKKITPKPIRRANYKKLRSKAAERRVEKLRSKTGEEVNKARLEPNRGYLPGLDLKWHKYDAEIGKLSRADKKADRIKEKGRTLSKKQSAEVERTTPTQMDLDFARKHRRDMNEEFIDEFRKRPMSRDTDKTNTQKQKALLLGKSPKEVDAARKRDERSRIQEDELQELSLQGRRKLARRMKRTAKKRARVRKRKEKRRKTKGQLVAKANKQAVMKVRQKLIRGMKWKDVPYLQREKIDAKVKKKKARIAQIAKRLMPAMQKQEKARLEKVRARMTTNDPKKAIAPVTEYTSFVKQLGDTKFQDTAGKDAFAIKSGEILKKSRGKSLERYRAQKEIDKEKSVNESIDVLFEQYIEEVAPKYQQAMRKAGITQQGSKAETGAKTKPAAVQDKKVSDKKKKCPTCDSNSPVEVKTNRGIEVVLFKDAKAEQIQNNKPLNKGSASSVAKKQGFICGTTAKKLGICTGDETTGGKKASADAKGGAVQTGQEQDPTAETPTQRKARVKAEAEQGQLDTINREVEARTAQRTLATMDQEDEELKARMDAIQAAEYKNSVGAVLGIKAEKPKKTTKLISTKNGQFEDWHEAVLNEAGLVAVGNGCVDFEDPDKMTECLRNSGISDGDIKNLAKSPTAIPAARRIHDRIIEQFGPDADLEWSHTGTGMGDIGISSVFGDAGASNTTPKTDLIVRDRKTGKQLNLSMKVGPGQLMSAQAGESLGTIRSAMNRIKGCKGYDSETKTGTDCQSDFGNNKVLVDEMHKIKDKISEVFVKTNLGEGTGPIGWWTSGNISGQKPSWWDAQHPNWDWDDARGTDPNKNMGKFNNLSRDDRRNILEGKEGMKDIQTRLNKVFESGEFGELIKQHVMYEAMTGCGKFCPDCCGIEICDECDAAAKATHLIVANKDGTGGMIEEIGKPKSDFMNKASGDTTTRIDFKTTQPKKTVSGWVNETNPDIASKIQLPSRSKKQMSALKDSQKNQTKEWEARKLTKTQDKQMRQHLEKSGTNIKEYEWSGMPKREQTKVLKKAKISSDAFLSMSKTAQNQALKKQGLTRNQFFGLDVATQKKYLSKEHKRGKYTAASSLRMGMGKPQSAARMVMETFTNENGVDHGQWTESMEWIGSDPSRLAEFLELEPEIDASHGNYAETFKEEDVKSNTEITIDGEVKKIPVIKDYDYRDYQKEYEEGEDLNESFRVLTEPDVLDNMVQSLRDKGMAKDKAWAIATSSLQKRGILKKGTHELAEDCGCMNEDNTAAVAKQVKQAVKKHTTGKLVVRSKGGKSRFIMVRADKIDNELRKKVLDVVAPKANVRDKNNISYGNITSNIISAGVEQWAKALGLNESVELDEALRQDVYALVDKKGKVTHSNLTKKNAHKEAGNQGGHKHTTILLDPEAKQGDDRPKYAFKESSVHGLGSFSNRDIQEGDVVSLYYLNLLEDTPEYQRTDFCRLTNHSYKNQNISLSKIDGNIIAVANRDIQEGEELFVDYFHVYRTILPLLQEDGKVISEVLRWTEGYEDMEIVEDSMETLEHELALFIEIGDCPNHIKKTQFYENFLKPLLIKEDEDPVRRAKRLKKYNAEPEQRARRSARTNERNKRIRKGQLAVGDGKDIDHKDGNPMNNSASNISITSQNYNRGRNNNKGRTNEEGGAGEIGTKELLKKYLKDTPHMTIDSKFIKEMG